MTSYSKLERSISLARSVLVSTIEGCFNAPGRQASAVSIVISVKSFHCHGMALAPRVDRIEGKQRTEQVVAQVHRLSSNESLGTAARTRRSLDRAIPRAQRPKRKRCYRAEVLLRLEHSRGADSTGSFWLLFCLLLSNDQRSKIGEEKRVNARPGRTRENSLV